MKNLVELVKEEIEAFIGISNFGALTPADHVEINKQALLNKSRLELRMKNDPALTLLIKTITPVLILMQKEMEKTGITTPEIYELLLSSMIVIWEKSHDRFNAQLKPKP